MPSFTDAHGKTWSVRVDVAALQRIKDECDGLNLLSLLEDMTNPFWSDPAAQMKVLYAILKPQGASLERLMDGMGGEIYNTAQEALIEACIDFFAGRRKEVLKVAWTKAKEETEKALQSALKDLSGNAPESQE